ncbi:MAG: hypothetical protein CMP25_03145 [Rickettsiales bacterium]|nr:hypothetical protein [Rickettsiales bacterium]
MNNFFFLKGCNLYATLFTLIFKKTNYLLILFIINLNLLNSQELDSNDFLDRLDRLERNILDLQKGKLVDFENNLTSGYISRNESRLDQIETDSKSNFGKNEELENKIMNLEEKLNIINTDLDLRFSDIESKIDNLINSMSEVSVEKINEQEDQDLNKNLENQNLVSEEKNISTIDQNKLYESNKSPKEKYSNAIDLLWRNKYDEALKELKNLKLLNPIDLMPNIQYWLGEVYYAKKDFNQAIIEFGEGLKKFPDSIKGPDNMLKLGLSFSNLSKNKEACNVFLELLSKYPNGAPNVIDRANKEREKLNCIEE